MPIIIPPFTTEDLKVISPFGPDPTVPFIMLKGVRWDRLFSKGVDILPGNLTVNAGGPPDQGACVPPEIAQSSGKIYWEVTLTQVGSVGLQGGIGLCKIEDIANFDNVANGLAGCTLRPDGDVYAEVCVAAGFPVDPYPLPSFFPTLSEGDTIGFLVDFTRTDIADCFTVSILGVGGSIAGTGGGLIFLDPGNYIPCVAFGNASMFDADGWSVTANFSDYASFLGPAIYELPEDLKLGWPNTP